MSKETIIKKNSSAETRPTKMNKDRVQKLELQEYKEIISRDTRKRLKEYMLKKKDLKPSASRLFHVMKTVFLYWTFIGSKKFSEEEKADILALLHSEVDKFWSDYAASASTEVSEAPKGESSQKVKTRRGAQARKPAQVLPDADEGASGAPVAPVVLSESKTSPLSADAGQVAQISGRILELACHLTNLEMELRENRDLLRELLKRDRDPEKAAVFAAFDALERRVFRLESSIIRASSASANEKEPSAPVITAAVDPKRTSIPGSDSRANRGSGEPSSYGKPGGSSSGGGRGTGRKSTSSGFSRPGEPSPQGGPRRKAPRSRLI